MKNRAEYMKSWRAANKDKIKEDFKSWAALNKDKIKVNSKNYRENNKDHVKQYRKNYMANSIKERVAHNLRSRLHDALNGKVKFGSAVKDLGCSVEFLKTYLESKFDKNMTWKNYGVKGWHIDHIKPISSFDLSNKEQLKIACHHTNLQPMWWKDNLVKGSKDE